jgi:hypothetical protein
MNYIKKLILFIAVVSSVPALAYDIDTHFYGTYSMARFAGIRHEVALKIATATQWMDESYISDPVSMILLPQTGLKKRRLLHFPASRLANKLTVDQIKIPFFDPSSNLPLKVLTETEAEHEFATELFTEGLMEGNLMKAGAGLHTLEDSFAHAGTFSELGHAHFWHNVDRPFIDEANVEKYFMMTRAVFKAMVAIRSLLPMDAIDTSNYGGTTTANYLMTAEELADIYKAVPAVRATVSRKILNDPSYVRFALENVFQRAKKANYVKDGYQSYLGQFNPGEDTYQAAASVAKVLPEQLVDIRTVLTDTGYNPNVDAKYILSLGGISDLLGQVMLKFITGIVPRPLTVFHLAEKEEDGPLWVRELDLRVANMRALVYQMYNTDIYFVKNNTGSETGFLKEISKSPEAKPNLPKSTNGVEYVTYSLSEKAEFNQIIFSFLFPKLADYTKDQLPLLAEFIGSTNQLLKKDVNFADKLDSVTNYFSNAWASLKAGKAINPVKAVKIAEEDLLTAHIVPHVKNKYYKVPSLLHEEIESGNFKPLVTSTKLKEFIEQSRANRM